MDFPTRLELFDIGRDYVVQRAVGINPQQVNIVGSDANIFVASAAHIAYQVILQLGFAVAGLLIDTAEGDQLDRLAWDRYQLSRKGASASLGNQRFFRASSAAGAGTIPQETKLTTLDGVEFVLTADATFSATALEAFADNRSVQAGSTTDVGANTIRAIEGLPGGATIFDATVQTTNPQPTAGGADAEDDDTFRARIRDFWRTARRGTLAAIEFGAKTVPGVESAQASEAILVVSTLDAAAIVAALTPTITAAIANPNTPQLVNAILATALAAVTTAITTAMQQLGLAGVTSDNVVQITSAIVAAISPVVSRTVSAAVADATSQKPNFAILVPLINDAVKKAVVTAVMPQRVVNLGFADPSGTASLALAATVLSALDEYRAAGIAVLPQLSQPQLVPIQLQLAFTADVDSSALSAQVRAAVVEYVNSLPINTPLIRVQLGTVLTRYVQDGLIVTNATIASPTGDVYPSPGKTLRTTLDIVTLA